MPTPHKFGLPRKRKKAFKKEMGATNYIAFNVLNEIFFEESGEKPRYRKTTIDPATHKILTVKHF